MSYSITEAPNDQRSAWRFAVWETIPPLLIPYDRGWPARVMVADDGIFFWDPRAVCTSREAAEAALRLLSL